MTYKEKIFKLNKEVRDLTIVVLQNDSELMGDIFALISDVDTTLEIDEAGKKQQYQSFVDGLLGWIYYGIANDISRSTILTNCVHDLGEFDRNRFEPWFSPRTKRYANELV